jgi:acyl carrier protein
MPTTFEAIAKIIADAAYVPIESVTPGARWNDLGVDSLDLVEILCACEDDFLCDLPEAETDLLSTVGELVLLIDKHRKVSA